MKRPHRALVGIMIGLVASAIVASAPAQAQEKAPAKKRPHSDSRTPYVHRIQLRDDQDNPISIPKPDPAAKDKPAIKPPSVAFTCGKCHDYPTISSGWHSNAADPNVPAGRRGEPWILTDDALREDTKGPLPSNTRTQLPLSYRGWDGTWKPSEIGFSDWDFAYAFGRQLPGGGILETSRDIRFNVTGHLQNDCLVCHIADNNYDGNARYEQIVKKQNFKYAPLVAAGVGLAEKGRERLKDTWVPGGEGPKEPTFDYDLHRFNEDGHILLDVTRRVPNERCYFCHTSLATDKAQAGGLAQIWRHDRDIHLIKGMLCVDCHRNGLDHAITRGYEKESEDRKDANLASLTCQGCHYGAGEHATGSDLGGRNAAPRPVHKGLPTLHFDKLSCTACHSGPYPGDQAKEMLTSMAHKLGTESFNRTDQAAPTLQAPVFLVNQRTHKITPNKVLYPTFWGRLNGEEITPITPDLLNTSAALRKIFGPKPTLDGQPAKPLTEDEIVKALDAIAQMKPVAPKTAEATTKPTTTATTTASASSTPAWYTGEPVFVTGGKAYKRSGNGKLTDFTNKDAEPYTWELAHDVRGAQQALGARGCTDCHASGTPLFDSKVSTAALFTGATTTVPMYKLRGDSMGALAAFASTYPLRPVLITTGYTCAVILLLVLIAYGGRAVTGIARRSARRNV